MPVRIGKGTASAVPPATQGLAASAAEVRFRRAVLGNRGDLPKWTCLTAIKDCGNGRDCGPQRLEQGRFAMTGNTAEEAAEKVVEGGQGSPQALKREHI